MLKTIIKLLFLLAVFIPQSLLADELQKVQDYKVYVMLGMHTSFYHSWRGDTPDNDGYGQDIDIIRHTLSELDRAKSKGMDAKVYWDFTVHWTLGEFLPKDAPDIISKISSRVSDRDDEILVGPYNNGANSAVSADIFTKMLELSLENPGGYGLKQVFPSVSKIYRPQEAMFTSGHVDLLVDSGFEALILPYSTFPFTSFSNFVETIPFEKRFNPIYLRDRVGGKKIVVLPSISVADLVNFDSLENLMVRLRRLQESGEVRSDLVININFDADAESWEPIKIPIPLINQGWAQKKIPNSRGIREYLEAVNKYDWASFTTPKKYLDNHPEPDYEVYVPHDLADGAFDGYHSWAERSFSQDIWSEIEKSRLVEENIRFWSEKYKVAQPQKDIWDDASFYRALGASTTHYGMSTPFINYTRIERAKKYAKLSYEKSKDLVLNFGDTKNLYSPKGELYSWRIDSKKPQLQKIKILLEKADFPISLVQREGESSKKTPFGFLNTHSMGDQISGELWFIGDSGDYALIHDSINGESPKNYSSVGKIQGKDTEVIFGKREGIQSFKFKGQFIGGEKFMKPFLTYKVLRQNGPHSSKSHRTRVKEAKRYKFLTLYNEIWGPFKRSLMQTDISFNSEGYRQIARGHYYFTAHDDLEGVIADVKVQYPFTLEDEIVEKSVERRYFRHVDWNWIEVAPFEIRPSFRASKKDPFRLIKENYMGIENSYFLNFGDYNSKNETFDSLNNHITAHFVAISNGDVGLAVAKDNREKSSFAFAPIRLKKDKKSSAHSIRINPFGSYFGKQFDYSQFGGSKLGTLGALKNAPYIDPNAPSFNGKRVEFRLWLRPFSGDLIDQEFKEGLISFSDGSKSLLLHNPYIETVSPEVFSEYVSKRYKEYRGSHVKELQKPYALAPNAKDKQVYLVWEYPFEKFGVERFQIDYRIRSLTRKWQTVNQNDPNKNYITIDNLKNGQAYEFRVRAIGKGVASPYSRTRSVVPTDHIEQTMFEGETGPVILWKFIKAILRYNDID